MITIWTSFQWVRKWLMRPICALKILSRFGQGIAARGDGLSLFDFLAYRFLYAVEFLSLSCSFSPLCRATRHLLRFLAACSQVTGFLRNDFRDSFKLFLKHFLGPPRERLPYWSSPNSICLGSRLSGIRATCPAQPSWDVFMTEWMLGRPARLRISVS